MSPNYAKYLLATILVFCAISARGLQMMPNPYGAGISLDDAKKVAALAIAEARKNKWNEIVAIVDSGGTLVYYEKMDNAQTGSEEVAIAKARSATHFKRPTKVFEDMVTAGGAGLRILGLKGAVPLEGGLPLLIDDKIVGGIGVSGDTGHNDGVCAKAGSDALAKQ
jgi:glc operon protein GlcG